MENEYEIVKQEVAQGLERLQIGSLRYLKGVIKALEEKEKANS